MLRRCDQPGKKEPGCGDRTCEEEDGRGRGVLPDPAGIHGGGRGETAPDQGGDGREDPLRDHAADQQKERHVHEERDRGCQRDGRDRGEISGESEPKGRRGSGNPAREGSYEDGGRLRGRILFLIPLQPCIHVTGHYGKIKNCKDTD